MPTIQQLVRARRIQIKKKTKSPALVDCPQRRYLTKRHFEHERDFSVESRQVVEFLVICEGILVNFKGGFTISEAFSEGI